MSYAYLTMQQSQRHSVIIYKMENDFVNHVKSLANQYWVGKVSYINVRIYFDQLFDDAW